MNSSRLLLCVCVCALSCATSYAAQFVTFANSTPNALDATGHTVVGGTSVSGTKNAFIWQQATGLLPLEAANGATIATGITPDGQTIVGVGQAENQPPDGEAFITNTTLGFSLIGNVNVPYPGRSANAVTADGKTVVGTTPTDTKTQDAYRWTAVGGFQSLGDLPGGTQYTVATGISAGGGVIAGFAGSYFPTPRNDAFRWTQADGIVSLGDLAGGESFSWAYDVSANGQVIIGQGSSDKGREAFRWDQGSGMVGLGILGTPNTGLSSSASAVSADGSVILGWSGVGLDSTAFIWDAGHGMRSLQAVVSADPSIAALLTGWTLNQVTAISDNGQAIVGLAVNTQGQRQGFLLQLDAPLGVPEPSTLVLCTMLCAMSLSIARKR